MTGPSRRQLFLAGTSLLLLAGCGEPHDVIPTPGREDPVEPPPPIGDRIALLEQRHNAIVGFYGVDLESNRMFAHRDDDRFAMCSTFKAYLAARVLQKAQHNELALTDTVHIDPAAVVGYSPVAGPKAGSGVALSELCRAALQQSDNTAANALLRTIGGPRAITEFARSIGDEQTRLDRWETDLNSAIPGDPRDTSTPHALGGGIRVLLTGSVLDEHYRKQLEEWMRGNVTSSRSMRAGLPQGWTTADKTGTGDYASTNDVGIAYGPAGRRVLLSIMTRTRSTDPKAEALQPLIAAVTTLVLPWLLWRH
ncbi:MAG: class A beta-lactamase [Mycobacterium sp.]